MAACGFSGLPTEVETDVYRYLFNGSESVVEVDKVFGNDRGDPVQSIHFIFNGAYRQYAETLLTCKALHKARSIFAASILVALDSCVHPGYLSPAIRDKLGRSENFSLGFMLHP